MKRAKIQARRTYPGAAARQTQNETKKKDAWDKAQIVSGFISSVVLAGVGVMINISIQRAQIAASEANANAQIEAAKNLNIAQLTVAERNAELQRHLQESTLASQLTEHLSGNDP